MMYLSKDLWFPPVANASSEGLLAVGGDLSPERLLLAYQSGIFPWYNAGEPILWWSPDPRMVLFLDKLKVSKSFRKVLSNHRYTVTFDQAFSEVIFHCGNIKRGGQEDTWITPDMAKGYEKLHELGHAHSVEVWRDDLLVGGLYGVSLPEKKIFCGESMFSKESNTSKIALFHWVEKLKKDHFKLIDCQVYTPHLERLGAEEIPRVKFLSYLKEEE